MNTYKQTQVIGKPFVNHVNQDAKPTIQDANEFIKKSYQVYNDNLINTGYYKHMGYRFDFTPYLKKYLYKQYGQWSEAFAPNKTTLRKVIYGTIEKIIELN